MATKTHRLKILLGLWVLTVTAGPVAAQVTHHPDKHGDLRRLSPVDATTTFRGEYDARSGTLHGLQELEYRNESDSPLNSIVLSLSTEWDLSLDSILQYGVPLDSADILYDSASLRLTLSQPIPPHQGGFFLLSFTQTRKARGSDEREVMFWSEWLPRVAEPSADNSSPTSCGIRRVVPTRSFVDLTVDSSLRVYSGGELVNEKEMNGLLPQASGLLEDISSRALAADHQTPYRPVFEGGFRRYFLRYDTESPCPLLIGPSSQVDRITFDSLTVDIVQPPRSSKLEAHRFSSEVLAVIESLQTRFNSQQPRKLLVFHTDHAFPRIFESAVGVNRRIRPWSRQRADLVVALTRWWFRAGSSEATRSEFHQGMVSYAALSTAFDLHGSEGARILRRMNDPDWWSKYRRGDSKLSPLTCTDSLFLRQARTAFHEEPKRWHILRDLLGDDAFHSLIRSVLNQSPLNLEAIRTELPDATETLGAPLLEVWHDSASVDSLARAVGETRTEDSGFRRLRSVPRFPARSLRAVIFGDR